MSIKVFNGYFLNFDILGLNPSNFTFKMANFLIDPLFIYIFLPHFNYNTFSKVYHIIIGDIKQVKRLKKK